MLKNYFKIAIAVFKRRKFFTFISLFGISFTLTILVVLAAFVNKVINDSYPDKKRNQSLYINTLTERGKENYNGGSPSYYFLDHYVRSLKTPAKLAISTMFRGTNTYVNNKKVAINYKYTNADYWDVTEYEFSEGKAFTKQQIDNAERVAIISEDTKKAYFGEVPSVVGKYIEADNVQYRVNGVVKNVPITLYMLYGDIYLPYTVSKTDYKSNTGYRGDYLGILLAPSAAAVPAMKKEFDDMMKKIPMSSKDFDRIYCPAETFIPAFFNTGNDEKSGITYAITAIGIFTLFVMLLPALNLININITRIMERSSEIGVRKAFGASSRTLVYQFIVENIILTLIGGLIGFLLSFIVIKIINSAELIANLQLSVNFTVLFAGIIICLVFGLVSGVYPAWRMSRMNVVNALKAQ